MLDFHYPDGLHRTDFERARWRLQVIAEMGFGSKVSQHNAMQAAAESGLKKVVSGPR